MEVADGDRTGRTPLRRMARRWCTFNAVGVMGAAVQVLVLTVLIRLLGVVGPVATALAVEAAILHNFLWHERWTWGRRHGGAGGTGGRWHRLARFNLVAGALSITSNVALTAAYAKAFGIDYVLANVLAIGSCSILTFLAGDRLVFRPLAGSLVEGAVQCGVQKMPDPSRVARTARRRREMTEDTRLPAAPSGAATPAGVPGRTARRPALAVILLVALAATGVAAAELKDETVAAWNRYIEATEQRIAEELADGDRFLVLDFGENPDAARERLVAGEVRVDKMESRAGDGKRIRVPKGTIHHWRGSVLIPDVALEDVLHGLIVAIDPADLQDDVVESRVIERDGDRLHLFLRIRRRQFVTADYNTEHQAVYTRHGPDAASSRTTAIRIAELEDVGSPNEREKPIGQDRGFLWRLHTYWRYQQVAEGVIAECESVTLSRGIPRLLGWMVRPLVNRTAREVLTQTMTSISTVLSEAGPLDGAEPQGGRAAGP